MWQLVHQLTYELPYIWMKAPQVKESPRRARWTKPEFGWVKLNVDGSLRENPISTSYQGLICDEFGEWIAGFHKGFGSKAILQAELLAI